MKSSPIARYSSKRVYEHLVSVHRISRQRESLFLVVLEDSGDPKFSVKLATGTESRLDVENVQDLILSIARERKFVVAHTHPSGSKRASGADRNWTKKFKARAGAQLVEHMVVTEWGYGKV